MTRRDRILLTAVLPLLALAGAWLLLLAPKRSEMRQLDTEIAAADVRLSQARAQVAAHERARRELGANLRALAVAGRAVPAGQAMPALLRQLEGEAGRAGVRLQSLAGADAPTAGAPAAAPATTVPPTGAGATTPVALTLRLDGRFPALQRYLARLDRFVRVSGAEVSARGRLLSVQSVVLTGRDGRLTAEVEALVHVLPGLDTLLAEATAAGAAVDAGSGAVPAAAAVPPPIAAVTP